MKFTLRALQLDRLPKDQKGTWRKTAKPKLPFVMGCDSRWTKTNVQAPIFLKGAR